MFPEQPLSLQVVRTFVSGVLQGTVYLREVSFQPHVCFVRAPPGQCAPRAAGSVTYRQMLFMMPLYGNRQWRM